MKATKLHHLSAEQKAVIFDQYITEIEILEFGHVRGTNQILERFEGIAIENCFFPCPLCKRGGYNARD